MPKANKRKAADGSYRRILREEPVLYNAAIGVENSGLNQDNRLLWDVIRENTMG